MQPSIEIVSDPEGKDVLPRDKKVALEQALLDLENLSTHLVKRNESFDNLEAGCLSCSFSAAEERQL